MGKNEDEKQETSTEAASPLEPIVIRDADHLRSAVEYLKDYINTYDSQHGFESYTAVTFINDMLYGMGASLGSEYRFAQGFDEFKNIIKTHLMGGKGHINVQLGEELFSFSSEQQWINKAPSWFANCGVPKGQYISIDAAGRVCTKGAEFMRATRENTYPITVYDLNV